MGIVVGFRERFCRALCEAYTIQELQQLTAFCLGCPLARIAGGNLLDVVVFELVEWAAKQPRMADLPVHAAQFKTDQRANVPDLLALRTEFEAYRATVIERSMPLSPTEAVIFNAVEARNRSVLLSILKDIALTAFIPPDEGLVNELADLFTEPSLRPAVVISAGEWLKESGSQERALPHGWVFWSVAAYTWANELMRQAGRFGAPGVAAICAAVAFDWPGAENSRRVLARLYDDHGGASGADGMPQTEEKQ
ncbi:effector-associated domain EAD1-containing protein [Gemmata sp. JC673]|uniref:Effector-associated domain EAD1-containing protein n=1 Tax=Gemmata algarum TaxID=2975278 RepID=A0ABU5EST5_9BACT|nr:effector-associated domain EAD1-containing protein [Gemmata algarum]MDY3558396.1 effector-associated domain EAD1-containing protein [Gemmata algarum]